MDVGAWLAALGLGEYEAAFRANAVDAEVLRHLTVEDLIELGVASVGHRRKLLAAIAQLGGEPPALPAAAPLANQRQPGERRHVAVLFADLAGYTSLTERLGAEAMHALLDAFFRAVDDVVERMGGRVDKHIGDCVMAVFGAPVAHGNDPERAALAAIEIQRAVRALAAERGQDIAVHIGVTLGTVVASTIGTGKSAEYAITGESVNLASRLTDAAETGETLISDDLYRVIEGRFDCARAETLAVKGVSRPVATWRLLGSRAQPAEGRAFVGRRRELLQFEAMLRTCLDEGAGQVAVLRGEAGIGKTRLGEEFERLARAAGLACHRGLVLDFGAETGRDAVRMVVRDLLAIDPTLRGEELIGAARQAVASGALAPETAVHLHDVLDVPQPADLRALYDAMDNERRQEGRGQAIVQVVRQAAAQQPRLLIVEDVHWAKPQLLRSLAQIARSAADSPTILMITTRVEGDPLDLAWRGMIGGTAFTTIDLSPLREEEAKQLCAAEGADPAAVTAMLNRAAGNPLFLQQLLRFAGEADSSAVPGTIQSLVQATVDQLSAADKAAIQAASVAGQRIDMDLLGFLTGNGKVTAASLVERRLLRPHGEGYLFVHALIRDAIYQSLLRSTRSALHLRAAEWFETRDKRLFAEHLAAADSPKAAAAFLAAASEAIARYHYETALGLIERGLVVASAPADKAALLLLRGETQHNLGRFALAEPAFRTVLAGEATRQQSCQALIGLAAIKRMTDDIDGALADLAQAETIAAADRLLAEQARIHFLRGNLMFPRGDFDRCLREHEAGLRFARLAARPDLEAASLGGLGDAEYLRGRMNSARQRLVQCVALARQLGLGRIEVANQSQVAHTMLWTGPLDEALAAARTALEAAMQVGHLRAAINAHLAIAPALLAQARYEECLEAVRVAEEAIERGGAHRFRQGTILNRGHALKGLGRRSEAVAVLRDGLAFAAENGFAFHGPTLESALALALDDPAEQVACLERAEAGIAAGCVGHNQFRVFADGIGVAYALRDAAMLRRYIGLARSYPPEETVAWSAFHALRGEALLHRLQPEPDPRGALLLCQADDMARALSLHQYLIPA